MADWLSWIVKYKQKMAAYIKKIHINYEIVHYILKKKGFKKEFLIIIIIKIIKL